MKRSLLNAVVLLCISFVFNSCEKDETPSVSFFTIDLTNAEVGNWIFATNEKGELLDIVRVEYTNRGIRQLKTNKSFKSIDLSFFSSFRTEQGNLSYNGTTYRNVPSSQPVSAGYSSLDDFGNSGLIGTMHVAVNNYPGSLSDVKVVTKRGQISPSEVTVSTQRIIANFDVLENSKWVIVSAMRNGVPVYYRQELQSGNNSAEVDFNSLLPMENLQILSVTNLAFVSGISEPGYPRSVTFLLKENYNDSKPITIGTVPGFARYLSLISKGGQRYARLGAPLSTGENVESKYINYSLDVTDRNLSSFAFSFSTDYDYKTTGASTPTTEPVYGFWTVHASATDEARKLFDFPEAILQEFPEMRNSQLSEGGYMSIYKSLNDSYTYTDFLNSQLAFVYKSEYEQLTISN